MATSSRIQIGDQYYVTLTLNQQPLYLAPGSFNLYITQGIQAKIPALKLEIYNEPSGRLVNTFGAGDGSTLDVEIGKDTPETSRSIKNTWRLMGPPLMKPMNGGFNVKLLCLLDCIDYINVRVPKSYNNQTSSQVTQDIASTFSFKTTDYRGNPTIDTSNDSQIWRPSTRSWADFATYLIDHAWADPTSAFVGGVDENKVMYFVNLPKLISRAPVSKFAYGTTGSTAGIKTYPILQHKIVSTAGPLNHLKGYSYKTGQEQQDGTYKTIDSTKMQLPSNYLEVNKSVQESIGAGKAKFTYRPLDAGNVGENREQAFYQNARIRHLYASGYIVLTEAFTDEDLLSVTQFETLDPVTRESSEAYKGIYVIDRKTRCIIGNRYYEKISLGASGKSSDLSGTMV